MPFTRAGLAARHRRVDEVQASRSAAACSSRATAADAVVWSTKTAPGFMPAKAPSSPSTTRAQVVVVADAGEDEVAPAAASRGVGRASARRTPSTQACALAAVRL